MTVIKVGGHVVADPDSVAELARTCRNYDGDLAVVHGGGPQLDIALAELGPVIRLRGLRVTSPEAVKIVQRELNRVGAGLARALREARVPAIHIPSTLRLFRGVAKDIEGIGRVGDAVSFDVVALNRCVPPGTIAVITPVAWDDFGPLNVNADEGAACLAVALEANRLVLATNTQAVLGVDGKPIDTLTEADAIEFLTSPAAQGGIIPKVEAAIACLRAGAKEVRIGRISCASGKGGTRLVPNQN